MIATQDLAFTPTRELPGGGLYFSERGVYPFQEEGTALAYLRHSLMPIWDTGTGKTHLAMLLAALVEEDACIDLALIVCEKGKVGEWVADFTKFTSLPVAKHHGQDRAKRLAKWDPWPRVLVTTYETLKADVCQFVKLPGRRGTSHRDGPMMPLLRERRCLVVYDECTKLRNRGSANYEAHEYMLAEMRKVFPAETRVIGLTATPIEKDWEDAFNQGRLIRPDLLPTVDQFTNRYVKGRDMYGRATYYDSRMHEFARVMAPLFHRKRKTDPDVYSQFPKMVEESRRVELPTAQFEFYRQVESLMDPPEGASDEERAAYQPPAGLWTVLRQIAGYPEALCRSRSVLAQTLVEVYGESFIRSLPSGKAEALLKYLGPLVKGQGAKAVVFTFFGQSVLWCLARDLRKAKFKVFENHGGMTEAEQSASRLAFRSHDGPAIFLTSDAGSRGINLPEALYVTEYESALTYAIRVQRLNRINRIDSPHPSVTAMTFIADGTLEEGIIEKMSTRNEWQDTLLGDTDAGENFITAADRRELLSISRRTRRTR